VSSGVLASTIGFRDTPAAATEDRFRQQPARATMTFTGVGQRYQGGAKKGQCDQSANGSPLAMLGSVIGRGTVLKGAIIRGAPHAALR
jgi:hypothetical protein